MAMTAFGFEKGYPGVNQQAIDVIKAVCQLDQKVAAKVNVILQQPTSTPRSEDRRPPKA
jgi:hypothetical protein